MKKLRCSGRVSVLLALLLLLPLCAGIFPAAEALTTETVAVLPISAAPGDLFRLEARDGSIFSEDLPADPSFDYLMLHLLDETGESAGEVWTERSAFNNAELPLTEIKDGDYDFELFTSSEKYGVYTSYLFRQMVGVRVAGGEARFILAPVYQHNISVYTRKRRDKEALAHYTAPSRGIESDDEKIVSLSRSLTAGMSGNYEKLMAIYDWVCENIWYDYDVLYGSADYGEQTALGTLDRRRGVCQGYASLLAALLRAAGIPAKLVAGYALGVSTDGAWTEALVQGDESNHAWNEAYVDGRWVMLDATWDSGNEYRGGKKAENEGLRGHLYLDPSMETLSMKHKISDYSEDDLPPATATPTASTVLLDGRKISFDAYNISDNNYFKLRDIAYVLRETGKRFEVRWVPEKNEIHLFSGEPYTVEGGEMEGKGAGTQSALFTKSAVCLNGVEVSLAAYHISDNNYFKLRDIGRLFDFDVSWDGASNTIAIETAKSYTDD